MEIGSLRSLATLPIHHAASTAARLRLRYLKSQDPADIQRQMLARLIERGADTKFGKDHGFAGLKGLPFDRLYERYRGQVPIRTYADFWRDYFFGCLSEGDGKRTLLMQDVTWPGTIPFFCETSGTTAPTKYIPFTHEMFAENKKAALDMTAAYLAKNPDSRLLCGKLLYMAGNTDLSSLGNGIWSGDMSAITLKHRPFLLDPFVEPSAKISALPWENKLEALAGILVKDKSIRAISGVPPWILLLLKRVQELAGEPLAKVLPELELIIHGGTSLKPYRKEFEGIFENRLPNMLELLPSSEGFMAFQLYGEERMRLMPRYGIFFEFVPFDELDDSGRPFPGAKAVPLEAVDTGTRYAVILSTCAGLWRYHIGDTIRFTSTAPHFIEFTGRDRFLDRFEEKVTQGEIESAVERVNDLTGSHIQEFMVGPDIENRRHLWVLAAADVERLDSLELARHLDGMLKEMNADYATFRRQGRIAEPIVVTAKGDLIYQWSKEVRGKLGGQTKIPHVDPTTEGEMIKSLAAFSGMMPTAPKQTAA